jgi:RNA polymerase sporulation-specific sigma factor
MDYSDLNDYELISYINENNEDANNIIIKKYEPLINSIATRMIKTCPYLGIDKSDLVQEGMIALNHAIGYFNEQKDITFYTYVKTCIERRLISTITSAQRLKHKNLNESLSFDTDEEGTLDFFLKDETTNPERIVINEESNNEKINLIKEKLTDLENQVFDLLLSSFTYKEIAEILDKEPKQIDNAIQRIKVKVKEVIKKYDEK